MGNVDGSVGGHLPCLRVGSVGFWLRRTQGKPQAHLGNRPHDDRDRCGSHSGHSAHRCDGCVRDKRRKEG